MSTPNEQVMQAKLYGLKAEAERWEKAYRDLMGRIAELEAQRGIPARCPDCGEYVEFHHYSAGNGGCIVECIDDDCGYATDEAPSWEDAWRAHQANVKAAKEEDE